VRFGDRLRARFDVDPGLADARVPSLIRELRPQPNGEFVVVMHSGLEVRASRGYAERLRGVIGNPCRSIAVFGFSPVRT